ncbi:MAG: hypothetical protein LBD75_05985 [Candidatus Peribacteria bacterium]|jgi:hypothetical protein|nr:hypothetical protein [Candidatus Peribacteria bacterium]
MGELTLEILKNGDTNIIKIPRINNFQMIMEAKGEYPSFVDFTIITQKNSRCKGKYYSENFEKIPPEAIAAFLMEQTIKPISAAQFSFLD